MPPSSPVRSSRAPFSRQSSWLNWWIPSRNTAHPALIVRKTDDNKYELIAGERRWRASGILGLSTVPAIIRKATDKDVLELALIENLQRENLSPLEEAAGYMRLKAEFKMKQGDIAKRVANPARP